MLPSVGQSEALFSFLGHDESSWGFSYHGKTQHAGTVTRYGEKWARGDIIGMHVDTWKGHVYCYKNGKPLGLAFEGLQVSKTPCIKAF